MTSKVYTVSPEDSVTEAVNLMKQHKIKHVPVVVDGNVAGIVSDRDIKEFMPSKATTLDMYELHYLISNTKIKDIMKTKVYTTTPDAPIEQAAMLMHDNKIGCLPVCAGGKLAGIISDWDIFEALVDITGVRHGGIRIFMTIEDRPGSIKEVADLIRAQGFSLQSILTSYEKAEPGHRKIVIRTKDQGDFESLNKALSKSYKNIVIGRG